MIGRDEFPALLEAYRDGSIDREDAERLAAQLRAGGDAAGPLMDDVEISSLLLRALDAASGEELVRDFFAGMGIEVLRGRGAGEPAAVPAPDSGRRGRFWRWAAAAAAAAAVAVGVWLLIRSAARRPAPEDSRVVRDDRLDAPPGAPPAAELLSGAVAVRPQGAREFAALPAGRGLLPGDTVRAGTSGPAEIDLLDKVLLVLDGGTEVTIAPDPALPCAVRLERGQVFAEVEKGAPFRVLTSGGEVRSLGTKFAVGLIEPAANAGDRPAGGFTVSVEQGAVEVSAGGEVARVESGSSLVLERGCPWRRESGEGCRRRLGWVEEWRGRCRSRGGEGRGQGQRHGQGRGSGGGRGNAGR